MKIKEMEFDFTCHKCKKPINESSIQNENSMRYCNCIIGNYGTVKKEDKHQSIRFPKD